MWGMCVGESHRLAFMDFLFNL